jgi:hypothetical protein
MALASGSAVLAPTLVAARRYRPARPLGLRSGTRLRWVCVRCSARFTAVVGAAPACGCGGSVRPKTTS